jgi:hypothetical protein
MGEASLLRAWRWTPQPIARRRLAAIVALLVRPRLQPLSPSSQQLHPLPRGGILGFQFDDPGFW